LALKSILPNYRPRCDYVINRLLGRSDHSPPTRGGQEYRGQPFREMLSPGPGDSLQDADIVGLYWLMAQQSKLSSLAPVSLFLARARTRVNWRRTALPAKVQPVPFHRLALLDALLRCAALSSVKNRATVEVVNADGAGIVARAATLSDNALL
jgi:hypothetical protein